jgi:hypothetical protein
MNKSFLISIIEFVIFIGIIVWGYNKMNDELNISEQNLKAYKNQIKDLELKNGELIRVRDSYILEIDQLQENFDISKQEVKELQKKLNSSLAYISKIESEIKIDTIREIKDSIVYLNGKVDMVLFNYKNNWVELDGITNLSNQNASTVINYIKMKVPLTVGITDDYQIFAHSKNPYVVFEDINGAVIDGSKFIPKEKRWSWGIHGGFGVGYDIITGRLGVGPYLGVGAQYNF